MSNKRILVIDDEESIQKVAGLGLRMEANWQIIYASSGQEGIEQAARYRPDAILLDIMMPELDGFQTFEQLQNQTRTQLIPVILLTAKTGTAEKRMFQNLGVAGVITKPFNPLTLATQVSKLLDWPL